MLVYIGTGAFGASVLEHSISLGVVFNALVTSPNSASSRRGLAMQPSKAEVAARNLGIPVWHAKTAKEVEAALEDIAGDTGIDTIVVCDFGVIISEKATSMAKIEAMNVHPSLLPLYRGAAPIARMVMDGQMESGATIIKVAPKLDAGDIIVQKRANVDNMTFSQASEKLAALSGECVAQAIAETQLGIAQYVKQDESKVTITRKISKEELRIDFSKPASHVVQLVRSLDSEPGAYALLSGKRVKLFSASLHDSASQEGLAPGQIAGFDKQTGNLVINSQNGSVAIGKLKPEGSRMMAARDFYNGLANKSQKFEYNE
ncbi:MAG: methionyl-tRNA formyltransferase [Eubacteriaceae bacterium]|nr:methionyl-tRNA formyltransferase [Eubacteriaceae bacterium]